MTKKPTPRRETATTADQRADLNHISAEVAEEEWLRHVDSFYRRRSTSPGEYNSLVAECRIVARQLHQNFLDGNKLAPFECAAMWRGERSGAWEDVPENHKSQREPLPAATLPEWVIEALAYSVGAEYYDRTLEWLEENAARTKSDKRDEPSLTRIAGLTGNQKQLDAWKLANREARGAAFREAYHHLVARARGEESPPSAIDRRVNGDGTFQGPDGAVPILNSRGEPTKPFAVALARLFGIGTRRSSPSYRPTDDAVYEAARKFL